MPERQSDSKSLRGQTDEVILNLKCCPKHHLRPILLPSTRKNGASECQYEGVLAVVEQPSSDAAKSKLKATVAFLIGSAFKLSGSAICSVSCFSADKHYSPTFI